MKFPKRVPVFMLRIVYKSGYVHNFEVFEFTVKGAPTNGARSMT
jgi:hypothetical protein